jgi:hypothetical protein
MLDVGISGGYHKQVAVAAALLADALLLLVALALVLAFTGLEVPRTGAMGWSTLRHPLPGVEGNNLPFDDSIREYAPFGKLCNVAPDHQIASADILYFLERTDDHSYNASDITPREVHSHDLLQFPNGRGLCIASLDRDGQAASLRESNL